MPALSLAVALLTVLRVRVDRVDRAAARGAMLLAPAVGFGLALVTGAAGWAARQVGLAPLPTAALCLAVVAVATRGLHLDGLADTADGLGAGAPGGDPVAASARALAVMRRSDTGPFGVVTLVLVLLLQAGSGSQLALEGHGAAAVLALVVGRAALPLATRRGVPAARPDGLGATVAGAVPPAMAALAVGICVAAVACLSVLGGGSDPAVHGAQTAGAAVGALVAGQLLVRRCVERFGGITGDVLGAAVEVTQTVYLIALAALL